MTMRLESIPEGHRVFNGDKLIGVITTKQHHRGKDSQHQLSPDEQNAKTADLEKEKPARPVFWEPLPKESWAIHFSSPNMSLQDLRDVIAVIPTEA